MPAIQLRKNNLPNVQPNATYHRDKLLEEATAVDTKTRILELTPSADLSRVVG